MKDDQNTKAKSANSWKRNFLVGLVAFLTIPKIKNKVVIRKAEGSVARSSVKQGVKSI